LEQNYKIAIIGQGYVGLPLAMSFSKFYETVAFDISVNRIDELNRQYDCNLEVEIKKNQLLKFTFNENDLAECDIYIVTVPTPVKENNLPDLSYINSASLLVSKFLKKDNIVIYESTVYPGVTEEICVPILESISALVYNKDFYCGYSPERINPGNSSKQLNNIVKVTSGSNIVTAKIVDDLYSKIIDAGTFKASSIRVAEASKVVENIQRDVNIALMNELAIIFDNINISTSDVLEASRTKWNFLDFKPGLVGGHCIGVDAYYMIYKSKELGYLPDLINKSRELNNSIPMYIVNKTKELLLINNKKILKSKILILGYSFKENCNDIRNTQVEKILSGLNDLECLVDIYDPLLNTNHNNLIENPFKSSKKYDAIIAAVSHDEFYNYTINDFKLISNENLVLLDIKNMYNFSTWKF
jgi:UDP-N-acetyl-D-galactosamine dehydrogenase